MSNILDSVVDLLTPYNYSNGSIDRVDYLVIHYVGATGGAKANCDYYASKYLGVSAHYYVGFIGEVYRSVLDKNVAWHCGTSSGYKHKYCRNSNSIGIELCVRTKGSKASTSRDWYFEDATYVAGVALVRELMKKYNIPADKVIRHYDVTGKICPNPFVYNHTKYTWDKFKADISAPEVPDSIEPGWRRGKDNKYWYERADRSWPANKWCIINHHYYWFDKDGYMLTGKQEINGDIYLLDDTPEGPLEGACYYGTSKNNGSLQIQYIDAPNDI